jgi:hypothetical protein
LLPTGAQQQEDAYPIYLADLPTVATKIIMKAHRRPIASLPAPKTGQQEKIRRSDNSVVRRICIYSSTNRGHLRAAINKKKDE